MTTHICPERLVPKVVDKGWGKEIWMVNNNKYCGKLLQFNQNAKFSMHYHIKKFRIYNHFCTNPGSCSCST